MSRRSTLTMIAAGFIVLCTFGMANADEVVKFRFVGHATSSQTQEVGDADGHVLGVARWSGLAFPDESVATIHWTVTFDYAKGVGPFSAYVNLTFKDGSVLRYKVNGSAKPDGTTSVFTGSIGVLGGNGRFEGAKGDGTMSGARIGPPETGSDQYGDAIINLKK